MYYFDNFFFNIDSYKVSYWLQYLLGIDVMFFYVELCGGLYDWMVFFGL